MLHLGVVLGAEVLRALVRGLVAVVKVAPLATAVRPAAAARDRYFLTVSVGAFCAAAMRPAQTPRLRSLRAAIDVALRRAACGVNRQYMFSRG